MLSGIIAIRLWCTSSQNRPCRAPKLGGRNSSRLWLRSRWRRPARWQKDLRHRARVAVRQRA